MSKTWKYFKKSEFECSCCDQNLIKDDLVDKLDKLRAQCGFPFSITSGYRCHEHNKEVGGVVDSTHRKGYAVDILCGGASNRFSLITKAVKCGFTRIGIYSNFIHLDIDPDKTADVMWTC